MSTNNTPPLTEFIELETRRLESLSANSRAMVNRATVAVYETSSGYQSLTIRISHDLALKYNLSSDMKMSCAIHPDQNHIALTPTIDGKGAALFNPPGSRALVYQTTLRDGTLIAQRAMDAVIEKVDQTLVITLR